MTKNELDFTKTRMILLLSRSERRERQKEVQRGEIPRRITRELEPLLPGNMEEAGETILEPGENSADQAPRL